MGGARVLAAYEALRAVTGRMLVAARAGDWDGMAALEPERDRIARDLMMNGPVTPGHPESVRRLAELASAILSCNEEIQALAGSRISELRELLGSIGTERRLGRAYGIER